MVLVGGWCRLQVQHAVADLPFEFCELQYTDRIRPPWNMYEACAMNAATLTSDRMYLFYTIGTV